ncbi:mitochondrial import inner membrane translocase subunit TIM14-3-like isoform X3 [Glycine max]|uniref:mitochondrial import inner membrane translocase subunit TIM14-3-like isoform X3 n=1 Tax=Glycine max TaxID=3847 RepID=UPI001B357250|nr:uncharacterized protein LOC100801305 isoform X3 [Glycine max]
MATPLVAGIAVAAAAYAGRYGIQAWQAFKARPPSMRKFYEGGFPATMTRREAALILGVRNLYYLASFHIGSIYGVPIFNTKPALPLVRQENMKCDLYFLSSSVPTA